RSVPYRQLEIDRLEAGDGGRILTAVGPGKLAGPALRLYDRHLGAVQLSLAAPDSLLGMGVEALAAGGSGFFVAKQDGSVDELTPRTKLRNIRPRGSAIVQGMTVSIDRTILYTAAEDGKVTAWNAKFGREVLPAIGVMGKPDVPVGAYLTSSPDGQ